MVSETKFKKTEIGMIPEEWYRTTLGSLVTFQRGHDLTFENKVEGPYPIVSSSGILGYHNEYKIKGPGITVGRSGNSLGKAFFVSEDYWPHNTILYAKKFHNIDPKFLYYLLKNLNLKEYNSGSAVPTLNRNYIHPIPVVVPEKLDEQKAISCVLSDLDDKIDLNRQMNSTLEQIAQTLFKRWFIEFEFPDENGNPYKSSGGRMVDSELGEIPEGWDVKTIDSVAKKVAMGPFGSNIKVSTFVEKGVPIISGQHLRETLLTESAYNYITEEHARKLANSCVSSGDIIFTHAGNIGQVSLIPSITKYSKYIISQRQFYLRPDTKQITSSYLVYFFRSNIGQHLLLANTSQVGVPSISRPSSYLKSIKIIIPGKLVLKQFEIIIGAIAEQIVNNREEIDSLVTTRDTLLPKLMSGKIRVQT